MSMHPSQDLTHALEETSAEFSGRSQTELSVHRESKVEKILNQKCVCPCPVRYVFTFLTFIACTLAVAFSSSVSIAIVSMVIHNDTGSRFSNECSAEAEEHAHELKGDFYWNTDMVGLSIAAVYYGQMVSFIPGGRLAELYGGKMTLIVSVLISSFLNLLLPAAAHWNVYAFIVVRFLLGIFVGPIVPVILFLIGRWIPTTQRSFQSSIIFSGYGVGCFISVLMGGALCNSSFLGGWPCFFYVCGLYGILWSALSYFFLYETPRDHPNITDEELIYITNNLGHEPKQIKSVAWRKVLTSAQMWLLGAAYFGQFWIIAFFFTVEPLYMGTILKLSIVENGQLSSLPHLARAIFAVICSYPVDWIIEKGYVSQTFVRKGATALNSFVSCVGFGGILISGCDATLTTVFFTIGSLLGDFITFGVTMATIEIAPNLAGTMCGLYNLIGVASFVILPSFVGLITRYQRTMAQWSYVFYTTIGVVSSTAILYALFGTVEPQPWGTIPEESNIEIENGVLEQKSNSHLNEN